MFTRQQQVEAIANALEGYGLVTTIAGSERVVRPGDFDEPWQSIAWALARAEPGTWQQVLMEFVEHLPDRDQLLTTIAAAMPAGRFRSLADLAPDLLPIRWLWPEWIPLGMLSLLGAVPGAGKSFVALDLARRIIHQDEFPDGAPVDSGGRVIFVDAENVPQLLNERADRWEMDKTQLYLMSPTEERMFIDFSEAEDRDRLADMAYVLRPAIIIVDSLSSISSRGENAVEDVRQVLAFLNSIALDMQCGLLLIHHLRKGTTPMDDGIIGIDDFRGSGHIIAIARSVLGLSVVQVGPTFDRNAPRRLEVVKTNLCRYPGPIGVEFVQLEPTGVLIRYGEAPVEYHEVSKCETCSEWLLGLLEEADEPLSPREIIELGRAEGFSRAMIYRARKEESRIVNTEGHQSPGGRWTLVREF